LNDGGSFAVNQQEIDLENLSPHGLAGVRIKAHSFKAKLPQFNSLQTAVTKTILRILQLVISSLHD
jgi:hypothetical protein